MIPMMHSKRSSSPSSAAIIIEGNDDLLMEILVIVPVKSLLRFQVVSKRWQSLISTAHFHHRHNLRQLHRPKPQPLILLRSDISGFFTCHPNVRRLVPFPFKFPKAIILHSCNGLLLLKCKTSYVVEPIKKYRNNYYVYNPTTMQHRKILLDGEKREDACAHPSKSPYYKVICFTISKPSEYQVEVYGSETHSWKNLGKYQISNIPQSLCAVVYCNDGIYFVRPHRRAFCFDLKYQAICWFSSPPRVKIDRGSSRNFVTESNGHLYTVVLSLELDMYLFIFEMDSENDKWFLKYEAHFDPIPAEFSEINQTIRLLGMVRGEEDELSTVLFQLPDKIIVYRIPDEVFDVLVDYKGKITLRTGLNQAHQIIETLASV